MNNEKFSYNSSQIDHVVENLKQTNILSKKNSKNNSNISRTDLDTQLIDLNADGDYDESKYNDEVWKYIKIRNNC